MAEYNAAAVHLAAVAAWRNITIFGRTDYGPEAPSALTQEEIDKLYPGESRYRAPGPPLTEEQLTRQTGRTPRLLGIAGDPTRTIERPAPRLRKRTSVPLSKTLAGIGFSIATSGPYAGPLMVELITVSTDLRRTAPSDGLLVVAAQYDFPQGTHVDALNGTVNLLGGIQDAVGTQFYAPGPTGQTAYVSLNRILDWPAVYFRASGQNGEAVPRDYGVLIQIAYLYADDPSLYWLPEVTPEVIYQRTARAAPLPRPRQPAYPRAVIITTQSGLYGAARRTIPLSSLDPGLLALALDPLTGEWRGASGMQAVW